jgi:lipoprotein signal peptidase
MSDRSYRILLWSLALAGLLADQVSKYGVFSWLHSVETHTFALFQTEPEPLTFSVVPADTDPLTRGQQRGFYLEVAFESGTDAAGQPIPHVNHGALFGFLRDYKTAANGLFALISLVAAVAIIIWSSQKGTAGDRWLCTALGLILAGTLGNFYDRLLFNGVRDFLHWNYLFDWPVFNVADCCLVVGASLLLLQAFFAPHPAGTTAVSVSEKKTLPGSPVVAGMACSASGLPPC